MLRRKGLCLIVFAAAPFFCTAAQRGVVQSYGKLPLSFEPNRGQAPADVSYLSRAQSGLVLLRPGSVALQAGGNRPVVMRFVGAGSPPSVPAGEQKLPGITSYLVGDKRDWIRGVPNYAMVRYPSVYPGIDALFHGDEKRLEYDFALEPGADPRRIRVAFEGVDHINVNAAGDLELTTAQGKMTQHRPRIWQNGPQARREVAGRYVLSGRSQVSFEIDTYDREQPLLIDPVIEYSTYFGSNRDDVIQGIATDSTGAAYVAGTTATGGVSWGFVSKLNPGGTVVLYSLYFGSGLCNAAARGIAVDSANNAIVTGYYTQLDASGYCTMKRVLGGKVNAAGDAFVYEIVWGGSQDYGNAVAVDGTGNAYFTGSTAGGFPTTAGVIFPSGGLSQDAFITKLDPTGAPVYSTYLGGGLADEGLSIAVDGYGNAYVGGSTSSGNFPATANAVETTAANPNVTAFLTEINSTAAQILYSTFLGGNTGEAARGVAVDAQGKIYVTGDTRSSNFPTTPSAWDRSCGTDGACNPCYDGAWHNAEDVFFAKIDPLKTGSAGLLYSTLLGGSGRDFGEAVAIDKNGRVWITGRTSSTAGFPTVQPTQATSGGDYDSFIAQIDPAQSGAASLLFSTFAGGSLYEEGTAVHADSLGNIYVAGYTGSTNFPTAAAVQPLSAGGSEGFILKIAVPAAGVLGSLSIAPTATIAGTNATGTVMLSSPAEAGGTTVSLTSSNTAASVPGTVLVLAGQSQATFAISTYAVTVSTSATITATYNGVAKTATLAVNPAATLNSVGVSPATVVGGAGSTGTVTLSAAAPAGGAIVTLASGNAAATVPASVTIAAGATTVTFPVTTKAVTAGTVVTISANYNGVTKTTSLVVNPLLGSVTLNPSVLAGGAGSVGTVTLNAAAPAGGALVSLASANTAVVTVPVSVTVAAGTTSATFAVSTKAVTVITSVNITATNGGASRVVTLVVNPPLTSVAVNPASVTGGSGSTGTVTLSTAAPVGGAVVALVSSNVVASVPASVTVSAGLTTASFAVTTQPVATASSAIITATYSGSSKSVTMAVNPPVGALVLNPASVIGGGGSTGTVTISSAAPAGGALVALTSSNAAAMVPASVTVAAGATAATFAITTHPVTTATAAILTATYNGVAKTATLTVNSPAALAGVTVNPAIMIFGSVATGTVTLTSAAPAGGAVVALASSDWVSFILPASVTVPAGAKTAQFNVTTAIGRSTTTITATYNGVNKAAVLTSVYPTVQALACTPNPIIAGNTAVCTVTMNGVMPSATTVWVSTDQPFIAPASGTVTVPAGATTTAFSFTTTLVPDQIVAHISADALATATVTTPVTINLTNRGRKWVLNNVVFKDGATANGYFTYDEATKQYLDANILVTPGPDPNNPLGRAPQNLYYYPWPNSDHATFVDNWSTASLLSMQNPIGGLTTPPAWTTLQLNFAQPLTNAGGTIALVTNPAVAYSTYCVDNLPGMCTPPPANIAQELFAMPPWTTGTTVYSGYYFRVIVSGTVTAQ